MSGHWTSRDANEVDASPGDLRLAMRSYGRLTGGEESSAQRHLPYRTPFKDAAQAPSVTMLPVLRVKGVVESGIKCTAMSEGSPKLALRTPVRGTRVTR